MRVDMTLGPRVSAGSDTESDSTDATTFRSAARAWIRANIPQEWHEARTNGLDHQARRALQREWQARLHAAGLIGLDWPEDSGGRGGTLLDTAVFLEECARLDAPEPINVIGLSTVGPTIIEHGTAAQKIRYLRPILAATEIWCQGFSEPDAGSDLGALRTSARPRGGHWVLTGHKVWTSYAQEARFCMLLARTGTVEARHRGLTCFLVDMEQPGIQVRPLRDMTGEWRFAEVWFDQAHVAAENILGEVDRGFAVALTTLLHERGSHGLVHHARARSLYTAVVRLARAIMKNGRPAVDDAVIRRKLTNFAIDIEAMTATAYRYAGSLAATGRVGPEFAILKLQWGELSQALVEFALDLQEASGPIADSEWGIEHGRWQYEVLRARSNTVAGGTTEIIRNVIAEQVLGLPRGR
jgi:alkylation response protein AidB-like acyl-CoA dehydrogenase